MLPSTMALSNPGTQAAAPLHAVAVQLYCLVYRLPAAVLTPLKSKSSHTIKAT